MIRNRSSWQLTVLATYPQIIGYDQEVYNYFKQQSVLHRLWVFIRALLMDFCFRTHLCGYDLNLTYPQNGIIPDPPLILPTQRSFPGSLDLRFPRGWTFLHELKRRHNLQSRSLVKRDKEIARSVWKREALQSNDTINPWASFYCAAKFFKFLKFLKYGCFLFEMLVDYAINYTFPWSMSLSTLITSEAHETRHHE